jgi:glycosyltransferase involved in cell wall biosynthesis
MIVDGENGRTVAPGDDESFILAAAAMAHSRVAMHELRERARRSVSGSGWDAVSLRFEAVLREAIGASADVRAGIARSRSGPGFLF